MLIKFCLVIFLINVVHSDEIKLIPLVNKVVNYKSKIYSYNTRLVKIDKKYKCKKYIDIAILKKNKYFAKHYIGINKALCLEDVYIPKINKVKFKFGNLEIEKEAELIKETKNYIKIKNVDGTIEKIYIDGRK